MNDNKPENSRPVEAKTQYSNTVNGRVIVKFNNLKGFITKDRAESLAGMARLWVYDRSTLTNFIKGRGTYPSCLTIINRFERHFGIVIEGDPYR